MRTIGQLRDIPPPLLLVPWAHGLPRSRRSPPVLTAPGWAAHEGPLAGHERTWDEDLVDGDDVRRRITVMADDVARQLRRGGFVARTVVLKLRSPDGSTITRSSTFDLPTASGERLREQVVTLWEREREGMRRIRLAGVRAAHLEQAAGLPQQSELTARAAGWHDLEAAMDQAVEKFGARSLGRGSTLGSSSHGAQRTTQEREAQGGDDAAGRRS